jgi:hypothetical protein
MMGNPNCHEMIFYITIVIRYFVGDWFQEPIIGDETLTSQIVNKLVIWTFESILMEEKSFLGKFTW